MATVLDYLEELDNQRDLLANFLTERGVESAESEKFNTLVPKVLEIASGGGGNSGSLAGVIKMDDTITSNKVNTLYREYGTITAGASALIADVSSMFEWDSKPESGAYSGAFFKGDMSNSKHCGFALMPSSTYPVGQLLLQQGISTQKSLPIAQHNGKSYAQHVNIAAWENGISICFPDVTNIWSYVDDPSRVAVTVGVCKSTNAVTGEKGWCAFLSENYGGGAYYTTVLGQSTTGTSDNSTHYDSASSMPFAVLGSVYFYESYDIPDDILMPMLFPNAGMSAMYGFCTFGGRKYYKNGNIFIPAE